MRYAGRASVYWNGTKLDNKNGATLDVGGITRNTQQTDQNIGFTETIRPAKVTVPVAIGAETSLKALNDISDATIQFVCDTGQNYVITGAWRTGELPATVGENSQVELTFEGPEAEEVSA